jgi:hypothetical protein
MIFALCRTIFALSRTMFALSRTIFELRLTVFERFVHSPGVPRFENPGVDLQWELR